MRVHMEHPLIEDHRCWLADNEANLLEISFLREFSIDRSITSYARSLGARRTSPIPRHIDVLCSIASTIFPFLVYGAAANLRTSLTHR